MAGNAGVESTACQVEFFIAVRGTGKPPSHSATPELLQLLLNLTVFLTPHSRIQKSGVAGVQELKNLDSGGDFPGEMPVPDFRIKTLLAYSATPATPDS